MDQPVPIIMAGDGKQSRLASQARQPASRVDGTASALATIVLGEGFLAWLRPTRETAEHVVDKTVTKQGDVPTPVHAVTNGHSSRRRALQRYARIPTAVNSSPAKTYTRTLATRINSQPANATTAGTG